jgi:DNA-binding transcriptional MerR regulator
MAADVDKGPDAFRTISEVADELDLPQHVLRFWEGRFAQIRPLKRGGGRRYYRPDDVELLKGIRHLLYGEGYTIRGVQRILKEQGVRFVMSVWQEGAQQVPGGSARRDIDSFEDTMDFDDDFGLGDDPVPTTSMAVPKRPQVPRAASEDYRTDEYRGADFRAESDPADPDDELASIAMRFAPSGGARTERGFTPARPGQSAPVHHPVARAPEPEPAEHGHGHEHGEGEGGGRSTFGALIDRLRPGARAIDAESARAAGAEPPRLSRDDVRHLQATLFELLECKRLLDQAR